MGAYEYGVSQGILLSRKDDYSALPGNPLVISSAAEGVLGNDFVPREGAVKVVLFRGPSKGRLELADNGTFEYTPKAGFEGMDTFIYTLKKGDKTSNKAVAYLSVLSEESAALRKKKWLDALKRQ